MKIFIMITDQIFPLLEKICGSRFISDEPELLRKYSRDLSFVEGKIPILIVWPTKSTQLEEILKFANSRDFSVIPVSSSSLDRYHGDTIPQRDNSIILDLSRMNKILNIDRKNRVVMVEPGVTFGQLIPILERKGLRLLQPLYPRGRKSVLAAALERVPTTIPRYQWDSSDPLLCTEVIFGTGDLFRTGTAAGPGTIKQQRKVGQSQVNPMGPTQFSPFRVIQGAQGSLGIVTWVTLKLELIPTSQTIFHYQSNDLQELLKLQHELLKYRLGNEMLILNNLNLACLVKKSSEEINKLSRSLAKWNLITLIGGHGKLASDKLAYQEGDISDIVSDLKLNHLKKDSIISDDEILNFLYKSTSDPWRKRLWGCFQDIFFITDYGKISEYITLMENEVSGDLGVYIQAINQGTSYHCEFDIYYDSTNIELLKTVKAKFFELSTKLMDKGAFFNRPYGVWAKEVFNRHQDSTEVALKKVKKIFDPNNVLNPGILCFDD